MASPILDATYLRLLRKKCFVKEISLQAIILDIVVPLAADGCD